MNDVPPKMSALALIVSSVLTYPALSQATSTPAGDAAPSPDLRAASRW
jgi:hypothetical protein